MSWELIRALFPRWNFFDQISYRLVLEVKAAGSKGWTPVLFNASRTIGSLFTNPDVTRMHAEMSLLESFANDIQGAVGPDGKLNSARVQKMTSFMMVRSLVMSRLMAPSTNSVQFRLSAQAGEESSVIYVSDAAAGDVGS
jgi:hypothetical protein